MSHHHVAVLNQEVMFVRDDGLLRYQLILTGLVNKLRSKIAQMDHTDTHTVPVN